MITPKKSLGQHFLRDENVARKIILELELKATDVVLEIGPGSGMLTKHLAGKCRKLIGVEIDRRAVEVLRMTFGDGLEIASQDVLSVDLGEVGRRAGDRVRIVGNIPYNITSEILFWIFQYRDAVQDATLMMQLEVAKRLMARPGTKDYGILSVASQFHCIPRLLFKVSPNSFFPRPDVESAMVQLVLRQHLPDCDQNLFQAVVRSTFGKRRKILRNGLKYMGIEEKQLGQLRFDLSRRPERLSVSEFVELTRKLTDLNVTTDSVQTPFDHEND